MSLVYTFTSGPVCPHCGAEQEFDAGAHAETGDVWCDDCGKIFHIDVEWTPSFDSCKVWSTDESPCGFVADGKWVQWGTTRWSWNNWLRQASSEWVGYGETGRCDARYGLEWRFNAYVFPWEDEA